MSVNAIKELFLKDIKVVKVHSFLKMGISIKENIYRVNLMEKEIISGAMEPHMKDNSEMASEMAKAFGNHQEFLQMCIKVSIWMT